MQRCNKHVIIYSGARVSELIRAIRSFISIDLLQSCISRMRELSVVNLEDSEVITLSVCMLSVVTYQVKLKMHRMDTNIL